MIIRSYSKSELCEMYLPEHEPRYAMRLLNKWLARSPGLLSALAATGYEYRQKILTPHQVQLIVDALGEP